MQDCFGQGAHARRTELLEKCDLGFNRGHAGRNDVDDNMTEFRERAGA